MHSVVASPASVMANGTCSQQQCANVNSDLEGSFTLIRESGNLRLDSSCVGADSECFFVSQASWREVGAQLATTFVN